jgi:gamma-glutamyltranspeptidase/glutathione hydrolase
LKAGEKLSNPNLATLLETLADRGSVDAFYRGDIGRRIAAEFGKHGGLVTAQDLASYQAREVEVLRFRWGGFTLCTAPLTAGGITVIEALSILKELNWKTLPEGVERDFARIEALRLAWDDRLRLLGDPDKSRVPFRRLLSQEYGHSLASRVQAALTERKPIPLLPDSRPHGGTVHLNAVDAQGNMAALTLTHGNYFGACVTIEEFGLTLGHGMSRFDPHPSHPNAPGPGKRPLHNMCPSIVLRDAMPILAIGATGGRKIPNALFDVLTHFMGLEESFEQSIVAPRLHTEGDVHLTMEQSWPAPKVELLKNLGYTIATGDSATVQAISFDPRTQKAQAAAR